MYFTVHTLHEHRGMGVHGSGQDPSTWQGRWDGFSVRSLLEQDRCPITIQYNEAWLVIFNKQGQRQ